MNDQSGKYSIDKQWIASRAKSEDGQEIGAGCDKPNTIEAAQMKEALEICAMIERLGYVEISHTGDYWNIFTGHNWASRLSLHAALTAAIETMKGNGE